MDDTLKQITDYPYMLTCRMISEILNVGYTKAVSLVRYKIPHIKIGNTYRIKKDIFVEWLNTSSYNREKEIMNK